MTMVKATANEPEVAMSSGVRSSPPSSLLFLRSATRGKGRGVVGQGRCAGGPEWRTWHEGRRREYGEEGGEEAERGGPEGVHVRLRKVRDDAIKHDGEEHGRLVLLVDRYGKEAAKDVFRPLRVHALALERLVERGHLGLEKLVFLGRHDESGALTEGGG